jgi:hypothetical protein
MEHFIRNLSPVTSNIRSPSSPPRPFDGAFPAEEFTLTLRTDVVCCWPDKYVCELLCISYYRRFIINSCFKSEVYVIDTNGCLILPVQNIYIHES